MSGILYSEQKDYLLKLRNEKKSFLFELEKYALENSVPIINWNAAELLEQLISIHKPKRVLELGTAIGYSAIRMASRLEENSFIDTIELSKHSVPIATENIQKAGFDKQIKIHFGAAEKVMDELLPGYDFIFLDVDKKDYEQLFYKALALLKIGGVIFVDNLLWQGYAAKEEVPEKYKVSSEQIRKFNLLFKSEETLQTTILPVGDGVGIGVKIK